MPYPSLEQYNEALQSPQLVLLDPQLKQGQLKKTGLGLPLALCGGFALTYTVEAGGKKYALRCFHKHSRDLEQRYGAISLRLKQLASPYFLAFDFLPSGIRIQGSTYPIVKMEWAQGRTLAEFLENNHRDGHALIRLRSALTTLAAYLEQHSIAHGDIQPENVMVSRDGSTVQLIDYDGMFVEAFRGTSATELGQVNFQHPGRAAKDFNEKLDRFSFLTLDVALQALIASPLLWTKSRSEPSAVVFRRNDFLDPASSSVFQEAIRLPTVKASVENLARVAAAQFDRIPSLAEFLRNEGISGAAIVFKAIGTPQTVGYQGAYSVCDAANYAQVLAQVGSRIELIGRIHSVRRAFGVNRRPYVFVNFSDWRGQAVKLTIWSDGLSTIQPNEPTAAWVGRWVSVSGLVDPPYKGHSNGATYTHVGITITGPGQIQQLPEAEAAFRLKSAGRLPAPVVGNSRNADVLRGMGVASPPTTPARSPAAPPRSSNQQLLDQMQRQAPARTSPPRTTPPRYTHPAPPPKPSGQGLGVGGWMVIIVVGFFLLRACAG